MLKVKACMNTFAIFFLVSEYFLLLGKLVKFKYGLRQLAVYLACCKTNHISNFFKNTFYCF